MEQTWLDLANSRPSQTKIFPLCPISYYSFPLVDKFSRAQINFKFSAIEGLYELGNRKQKIKIKIRLCERRALL